MSNKSTLKYWSRIRDRQAPENREYLRPSHYTEYRMQDCWETLNRRTQTWSVIPGYVLDKPFRLQRRIEQGLVRCEALHYSDLGDWGWEQLDNNLFRLADDDRWHLAFVSWDASSVLWQVNRHGRMPVFVPVALKKRSDMDFLMQQVIREWDTFLQMK